MNEFNPTSHTNQTAALETDPPLVSVILPVYKGEKTVRQAVNSILEQSLQSIELIAIDDGSPDNSWEIIKSITDNRIRCVKQENVGLAGTLNRGISLAKGKYIARLDQDDLSLPERLEKQFRHLENNQNTALVGTWSQIYEEDVPSKRFHKFPITNECLKFALLFDNPFVHSSVMFRTDAIRAMGGYCEDPSRQPPEDFELWSRVSRNYKIENIPEVLTVYKEYPQSMSRKYDSQILKNVAFISAENLHKLLSDRYSFEDCLSLSQMYHGDKFQNLDLISAFKMLGYAASEISDKKSQCSPELSNLLNTYRHGLLNRKIRASLPPKVLSGLRWLKSKATI